MKRCELPKQLRSTDIGSVFLSFLDDHGLDIADDIDEHDLAIDKYGIELITSEDSDKIIDAIAFKDSLLEMAFILKYQGRR